jgi:hypothetical protein
VHYWKADDAPEGLEPPGETSLARKNAQARDSLCFDAAALDPATFESFFLGGGDLNLARNYYIVNIIKRYAKVVSEGGAAVEEEEEEIPETTRQLNAAVKKILAEEKPLGSKVSDEAWQQDKERRAQKERDKHSNGMNNPLALEQTTGPFDALVTQLTVEMEILTREHERARDATTKGEWRTRYGAPFDTGNVNRKLYWKQRRDEMPVLFCMAMTLLPIPFASTSNERVHSVLGRILSKFRCSMTSTTLEESMLGYAWLRDEVKRVSEDERVKQKMSDRQVTTLEALELDDLDDVF